MYRYYLALRYLLSRPINLLGMIGVTLGVWALIMVVSIFSGFLKVFRSHVQSATSDVSVLGIPLSTGYDEIARVVSLCPSGALSYSLSGSPEPVEHPEGPSISVAQDGPYTVRGLQVLGGDGEAYDSRERQALCRCGGSRNKPFCDGTHWYMGFKHEMGDDTSLA